jgi:hypothetical protein
MSTDPLSRAIITNRNLSATSAPLREIMKGLDINGGIGKYNRLRYYNALKTAEPLRDKKINKSPAVVQLTHQPQQENAE